MTGGSNFKAQAGACAAGILAAAAFAGVVQAQSMNANSASFNAGYGRFSGEENQPVNVSMADA
ncbi:MAG TPA: endonuclease, partial [Caulobacteraceae bacterium]|nr:endonuclease [Caulobacteraceae bacterium]